MAADTLSGTIGAIARFSTGGHHFVYDVAFSDGRRIVVRVSRPDDKESAAGAVYWSNLLRPKGVPLPQLLHADLTMTRYPFPFALLERLPGDDLGRALPDLSHREVQALAARLLEIQNIVASLPRGRGFGFVSRYDHAFPHADWSSVIAASLARSRQRIRVAGIVEEHLLDRVELAADRFAEYFAGVTPIPFLHDITTRNVIVDRGRLSGIVDVDDLCFGDPLLLLGLIRTALLAHGHSLAYAEAWAAILHLEDEQAAALDFYTALFCVDFLGELGQRFNRAEPGPVNPAYVARLRTLLDQYLYQACERVPQNDLAHSRC